MSAPARQFAEPPSPPPERGGWLLASALVLVGLAVLVAVLTGALGGGAAARRPPPVLISVPTLTPSAASGPARTQGSVAGTGAAAHTRTAIVASPSAQQQALDARRFVDETRVQIPQEWEEAFYPIYETAQNTFGVNWLLIASIHMQESAFSTARGTYHGLNFAHCCAGPMQFNVTNGPVTTWDLVSDSFRYGRRPTAYDHMTARHPSVYDDFDSIMAGAHLLSADGAGFGLEGAAWTVAYDYYGHDATGVLYADQVLARAIGWSQHGFCVNCGVLQSLVQAAQNAYGAPVLAALIAAERAQQQARRERARRAHGSNSQGTGSGSTRSGRSHSRHSRATPHKAGPQQGTEAPKSAAETALESL